MLIAMVKNFLFGANLASVRTICCAAVVLVFVVFSSSCGGGSVVSAGSSVQPVPQISLRSTSLVVGPAAGTTGAALVTSESGAAVAWTAATPTAWIHLTDTSGSTKLLGSVARFTYDANPGATRMGAISFQSSAYSGTLTVTQAGVGYVAAMPAPASLLTLPNLSAFAVDLAGNVYYVPNYWSDTSASLQEWVASTGSSKTRAFPAAAQCSVKVSAATALFVNEAGTLVADLPAECPAQNSFQLEDITLEWPPADSQSVLIDYETSALQYYWAQYRHLQRWDDRAGFAADGHQTMVSGGYLATGFTGDTSGNLFITG
jgi:hypothetical protein